MTDRRATELVHSLRNMRKWGFTIVQDRHASKESNEDQVARAKIVARELLSLRPDVDSEWVNEVAQALVDVAHATPLLGQFN